jgi:hypothetical protein
MNPAPWPIIQPGEGFPTASVLRRRAYDLLVTIPFGAQVRYGTLTEALGVPATERRGRSAILAAGRDLLRHERHLLVNVRGVGYQIAFPAEHVDDSRRRSRNGNRMLSRAHEVVMRVIIEHLTDAEKLKLIEQQTRSGLALIAARGLSNQRVKIPPSLKATGPTGRELVRLLTTPKAKPQESTG